MTTIFGTDGIRGEANQGLLQPDEILKLALSVGEYFKSAPRQQLKHNPTVVIGKDTRLSGYMLEPALVSGFISMGMNVLLLGPIPTPAVAHLTRSFRAQLGVMISASHNPAQDNGVKFFNPFGYKLNDAQEAAITDIFQNKNYTFTPSLSLGRAKRIDDAGGRYVEFVKSTFPRGLRLEGFKIVVDCAHGAAYKIAPSILWELGAEVITIHDDPNGLNINLKCGATDTSELQRAVLEHGADAGVALDGDADRLIMVDEKGQHIDGDQLLALITSSWAKNSRVQGYGIVATQMSNLGLENYIKKLGFTFHRSAVGDRHVLDLMNETGCNIGGEQSGHIILKDYATTGDGLIAAMQILAQLATTKKPMSTLSRVFDPVPQKLVNVRVDKSILQTSSVQSAIENCNEQLKNKGRLLVRPSGTEPIVRIMVECEDIALIDTVISEIQTAMGV